MMDVLKDETAARSAIPELGYDWPGSKLVKLGEEVQAAYPELNAWPKELAAEAHLYYESRIPSNPGQVQARHVEFLTFLRAALAGHIADK